MSTPHTIPDLAELEQSIASRIMARLTVALITSLLAVVISLMTAAYTVGSISARVDTVTASVESVDQRLRLQDERTRTFYATEWPRITGLETSKRELEKNIARVEDQLKGIDGKLDAIQVTMLSVARKVSR